MSLVYLLGALTLAVWGYRRSRPGPVRRRAGCRWSAVAEASSGRLKGWRCEACGITAFSRPPGPPEQCKRGLEGRL